MVSIVGELVGSPVVGSDSPDPSYSCCSQDLSVG